MCSQDTHWRNTMRVHRFILPLPIKNRQSSLNHSQFVPLFITLYSVGALRNTPLPVRQVEGARRNDDGGEFMGSADSKLFRNPSPRSLLH